jgi:hypothetical protein
MSETNVLSALLNLSPIARVRRNHALEHATMQVLAEEHGTRRLVGRSSFWGFAIYGDVVTEDLLEAAREGLRRLKAGERTMAIHPNCGSNYVIAGAIAGLGAFLAMGGLSRDREDRLLDRLARLPLACAAGTLGVILSRPLGTAFQAHVTTEADVGDLRIAGITRSEGAGTTVHFVQTEARPATSPSQGG